MIAEHNYETGSDPGTGLTEYMEREDHEIRDHTGRELDDDEIQDFDEKCAENGYSRQIVLSPDRTDLTEDELDQAARQTMNEFTEDHNTTEYVYSVHQDTDQPHVHVACTATQDSGDLWLEQPDLDELQDEIAADHFRDHSTERQEQLMLDQGREDELAAERREKSLAESGWGAADATADLAGALDAAETITEAPMPSSILGKELAKAAYREVSEGDLEPRDDLEEESIEELHERQQERNRRR